MRRTVGATMPCSARWPRRAFIACVRCRIRSSRMRKAIAAPWVSSLFTATNRIVGRRAASQIASASTASFFCRLTKGFT